MPAKIRKITLAAMLGLTAFIVTLCVRDAEAFWPLSYYWSCVASSPTQVLCGFTVTNPGPTGYRYKWLFGDGSQTGRLTSTTVNHSYAVSAGQTGNFNVSLLGYSSSTSPLDNSIACPISFGNDYGVGGGPVYSGNCQ
jgi:hypothetical protein